MGTETTSPKDPESWDFSERFYLELKGIAWNIAFPGCPGEQGRFPAQVTQADSGWCGARFELCGGFAP